MAAFEPFISGFVVECSAIWRHINLKVSLKLCNTCEVQIPVDTCWYLVIPVDTCWYLLIPVDTCWYLVIPYDTCQYLSIPNNIIQIQTIPSKLVISWYHLVSTNSQVSIRVLSWYWPNMVMTVFCLFGIVAIVILAIFWKPSVLRWYMILMIL